MSQDAAAMLVVNVCVVGGTDGETHGGLELRRGRWNETCIAASWDVDAGRKRNLRFQNSSRGGGGRQQLGKLVNLIPQVSIFFESSSGPRTGEGAREAAGSREREVQGQEWE